MTKKEQEEQEELTRLREEKNKLLDKFKELAFEEMVNKKTIEKADELYGTNLMKEYEDIRRIHKERMKYTKRKK